MIYIPKRGDICWLDFEPTKGKEIGKYRQAFILSHETYNTSTGLLICMPISTSIRGASTDVAVKNIGIPCVVVTTLIRTLDWRERKAKFIVRADQQVFDAVLARIIPLIGGESLLA